MIKLTQFKYWRIKLLLCQFQKFYSFSLTKLEKQIKFTKIKIKIHLRNGREGRHVVVVVVIACKCQVEIVND